MQNINATKKIYTIIGISLLAVIIGISAALWLVNFFSGNVPAAVNNSSYLSATSSLPTAAPIGEPEFQMCINSPVSQNTTVTAEPKYTLKGICNPKYPLYLNDKEIPYSQDGEFSVDVDLKLGKNVFTLKNNETVITRNITYRYIVINAYNPSKQLAVDGETDLVVTVAARVGSVAFAEFQGQKKQLIRQGGEGLAEDAFCNFSAIFKIPKSTSKDQDLGCIKFSATFNDISESFSSGKIICKKTYIPQIAEVVGYSAETFTGNSSDNMTRPTNNYLPKGTVDYVTGTATAYDGKYKNNFLSLRCGRRIYSDMPISLGNRVPVATVYEGYLPDHNELSVLGVNQNDKYTSVTLKTLWKAPFFLDYLPQGYTNPAIQDYTVTAFTAQYIEIKFCYATVFQGEINFPADNPLFSHSQIIGTSSETIVRLFLKNTGDFYGWDCYYDDSNNLVFQFKHPVKVSAADNEFGVNLSGIKILIDAGHGGIDPGAAEGGCVEKERNLNLAYLLKAQLEKTGATVVLSRSDDTSLLSDKRVEVYRNHRPDFLISIHHDSNNSRHLSGFGSYYTTPFSVDAARAVFNRINETSIYSHGNNNKLDWHFFYMTRMTYCPSVLTENGYISNATDRANIMNADINAQKAVAIAKGITDYFKTFM